MTTRVLQTFDTLDFHSKSILDRLAKKNHQLTQVSRQFFAYGRSDTGLGLHREFRFRKMFKANKEIISHEQDLLCKRLRKSLAVTASVKGSFRSKSVEAGSSRDIIHSEKHTPNVKSSTGLSMCKDKEEAEISLLTLPKNPQTLWPCSQSPHRITWSREVEKFPSLHELTKVNRSKALVGISLGDTDICHWCSSSAHSEMDQSFKSADPDESINIQQRQENPDNISTETSLPQMKSEKEVCLKPVPLSFDELLERKDVKVLTPRLHKVYLFQQKASEKYPVVYSTQHYHYEPFRSPGFHSLDSAPQIRTRSMHSAILFYTESLQARCQIHKTREKQNPLHSHRPYTQPELKVKRTGVKGVNMGVLTADGKVIGSPVLSKLPLHVYNETPSGFVPTPIKKILLLPKQNILSPCVGPVINGMNPNKTCDSGKTSPAFCRPLPASLRRGLSSRSCMSYSQSFSNSSRSKTDFQSQHDMNCIITEKQLNDGNWNKKTKERLKELKTEVGDCDTFDVHKRSCSRQSSDAKKTDSPQEVVVTDIVSTTSTTFSEKTHRCNASSWQPETINIPTVDYLD